MSKISFISKTSNIIYNLELSRALLNFLEFDFSLFKEQSIDIGKYAARNNNYPYERASKVKQLVKYAHPFIDAHSNSLYEKIVVDCILEYICENEGVTLDELWQRCISPKNSYEKAIFSRISEYRTNRASNEWKNLVGLQDYARKKAEFVFGKGICSVAECSAKCKYFDLTYSIIAQETGVDLGKLPSVERFSISQTPNSPFILNRLSKSIYGVIKNELLEFSDDSAVAISEYNRDEAALKVCNTIKNMNLNLDEEIASAITSFTGKPSVLYLPNGLKALIDLEFEKMFENDILLSVCPKCKRFFRHSADEFDPICDRVNKSGYTCREENDIQQQAELTGEIEEQSQELFETLSKHVGNEIEETEFNEWSSYLTALKENLLEEQSSIDDLKEFLNYSSQLYNNLTEQDEIPEQNEEI